MTEVRKMKARVEAAIKAADPQAILQTTFFDDVSDRMFITIVKGSRKTQIALQARDFADGANEFNRVIGKGIAQLAQMPIG